LFHMNAQTLSVMGALLTGAGLILVDRFHPGTWWKEIREKKATIFHYLGVIPSMLIGLPEKKDDYNPVTLFGVGAGVAKDIHDKFEKRFNVQLLEVFGSTESGGGGVFFTGRRLKERKVGTSSFGPVMPEVEARIVDDNDNEVPHGQVGELVTRSSDPGNPRKGYFREYLKDPVATEKVWKSGWFHTGDFCKRDVEGYFYFVDRKKDMVRRSGENISASEVEAALLLHPKIRDVAVIPVPDKVRVEEIKAYIVPAEKDLQPEEVIVWCEERLAYFKIPRYIEFRETLPKTATQKIQKIALKKEKDDLIKGCWDRTVHMKLKREKK
jgi:acyl-CoA synthetase (AMP-forming)/AMP-acid ligase II